MYFKHKYQYEQQTTSRHYDSLTPYAVNMSLLPPSRPSDVQLVLSFNEKARYTLSVRKS
jgi:hypothetical protein